MRIKEQKARRNDSPDTHAVRWSAGVKEQWPCGTLKVQTVSETAILKTLEIGHRLAKTKVK